MSFFSTYGSMILYIAQLAFDIAVAVGVLWAASTFSRYVKFMTSDEDASSSPSEISVDEFVE